MRPNERFSGRGHARHVCHECAKLGPEELAYRQGVRNIDRLLGPFGGVPRKHRKAFEAFLAHPNPRLREYAGGIRATLEQRREEWREQWLEPSIEVAPQPEPDDDVFSFNDEDCPF